LQLLSLKAAVGIWQISCSASNIYIYDDNDMYLSSLVLN
jgi:hypothetical protein